MVDVIFARRPCRTRHSTRTASTPPVIFDVRQQRNTVEMDAVLMIERNGGSESERGRIRYPIQVARWNLYAEDNDETNLYLEVESDLQIVEPGRPAQDEWWQRNDRPSWSITLIHHGLRTSSLAPGTVFSLPDGYDESRRDFVTRILFDGVHQQTDRNTISILAVDGDRLLIRIEGQTIHGTWHEPVTTHTYAKLTAEAWFTRYDFQFCP